MSKLFASRSSDSELADRYTEYPERHLVPKWTLRLEEQDDKKHLRARGADQG